MVLIGFHDIVLTADMGRNGSAIPTVDKAWARIKRNHELFWEFIDTDAPEYARCGIGVVERATEVDSPDYSPNENVEMDATD